MNDLLTVGTAARELSAVLGLDVSPRLLTELFYRGELSDRRCPVIGGRRVIPRDYMDTIVSVLRRSGRLAGGDQ